MAIRTWFQHDMNASQKDGLSALIDSGGFEAYGRFWAFMELFYSMQINRPEFKETIRINERTILKSLQMNMRSLPKLLQLFSETLGIVLLKNSETFGNYYETTIPNSLNYVYKRDRKKAHIEVRPKKKEVRPKSVKVDGYSDDFVSFWKAYPKKKSKGDAWRAWQKWKPVLDVVLSSLSWQMKSSDWLKDGGQFIPYPATYLNKRCWEDERQSKTVKPIESNQRPAWKYDTPDEDCITGDDLKGIIGNIGRGME